MKIQCLITSLQGGGAQAAVPRTVKVMQACGHTVEVTVLEPRDMGAAHLFDAAGIPFRLLFPAHRGKFAMVRAFARVVRQSRPDVIWTSLSAAGLVGALTGALTRVPVVSWKNAANRRLHTRCLRGMSRLWIADSVSVAGFLVERIGVRAERVMTWPLFVQTQFTRWPEPWDGKQVLQIGSIGRLHPQKGYDFLIEALVLLRRSRPDLGARLQVTILGDGAARASLERSIVEHGLQAVVHLRGAVSDVRAFMPQWHLYVQPSRYEGMCLAAHEAMSAGLPVIATPVGELATSVGAGGGVLLCSDTAASLARAIEAFMEHPQRGIEMGRSAKAYIASHYSEAAFVRAGQAVIERVEAIVRPVRK